MNIKNIKNTFVRLWKCNIDQTNVPAFDGEE